jgi:hypothetical protein
VRLALLVIALCTIGVLPAPAAEDCGPSAPYECAVEQVGKREFPAAIRTLEQLLATQPKDLKALNLLGSALPAAATRRTRVFARRSPSIRVSCPRARISRSTNTRPAGWTRRNVISKRW